MAYEPKDRLFVMQIAVAQIKQRVDWHQLDIVALNHGFQSGVKTGLACVEAGVSTYYQDVSEAVKHLDESWGLARVIEEMNRIMGKKVLEESPFVEPLYATAKESKQYYYLGFDNGYHWIIDLFNAFMSQKLPDGQSTKELKKYMDRIKDRLVFE